MEKSIVFYITFISVFVIIVSCQNNNNNNNNGNPNNNNQNQNNNNNNNNGNYNQMMVEYNPLMLEYQQRMNEYGRLIGEFYKNIGEQFRNLGNNGNFVAPPAPPSPPQPSAPPTFYGNNNGYPFVGSPNFPNFPSGFPFDRRSNNIGDCSGRTGACRNPANPMEGVNICGRSGFFGRGIPVYPSGVMSSETRVLDPFTKIVSAGSFDITIQSRSGNPSVDIEADQAFLPIVITEVQGNTLLVYFHCDYAPRCNQNYGFSGNIVYGCAGMQIKVDIFMDPSSLNAITLAGSGSMVMPEMFSSNGNFEANIPASGSLDIKVNVAQELSIDIAGSGDVRFQGRAARARYSIRGSGDIDATSVEAGDVDACVMGSGMMRFQASGSLSVVNSGSGFISYFGNPTVVRRCTSGSGSIQQQGSAASVPGNNSMQQQITAGSGTSVQQQGPAKTK